MGLPEQEWKQAYEDALNQQARDMLGKLTNPPKEKPMGKPTEDGRRQRRPVALLADRPCRHGLGNRRLKTTPASLSAPANPAGIPGTLTED